MERQQNTQTVTKTRAANIAQRKAEIESRQKAREVKNKYPPDLLKRAILAYGEGAPLPEGLLIAAENSFPEGYQAAVEQRNGNTLAYVRIVTDSAEAHRIHRQDSHIIKKTSLPIEFFGETAVMVAPDMLGAGEYPKAPPVKATGGRVGYKWHEPSLMAKQTFTQTYSDSWRRCKGQLHKRTLNGCEQLISEAAKTALFRLEVQNRARADQLIQRFKKRQNSRYVCFPQDGGTYTLIHNQKKEGGDDFAEITSNYNKEILYKIVKFCVMTPEGTRIRSNDDFGHEYQGWKGDGRTKAAKRKRNKKNYLAKSFSLTSRWSSDALSRALNSSVSKKTGRGMDLIKIDDVEAEVETLVQLGAIRGLSYEQKERLKAFIAYCKQRISLHGSIEKRPKNTIDPSREKVHSEPSRGVENQQKQAVEFEYQERLNRINRKNNGLGGASC